MSHPIRTAIVLGCAVAVAGTPAAYAQHAHKHDERAMEADPRLAPGQIAPVLEGLGDHTHPVTAASPEAQQFFDQGLKLQYGFNHAEALRAFKEAARRDPNCAMAYWGWALALGPNLNLPMQPDAVPQAYEAIQQALALRDQVSEPERAYIDALAKRYTDDPQADRRPLDQAYADAMGELVERYPDDLDAATLYADSLMNLSPWDYWHRDGRPRANTPTILRTLESVVARDEHHEGALHLYIHATEARRPERAAWAGDRLRGLAPGQGHLTHMPSHAFIRVGRYDEAVVANEKAVEADEGYITQCRAQGIYPLAYYPHNIHFLAYAAILGGESAKALEASKALEAKISKQLAGKDDWALYETFLSMPMYTLVRFGKWEEMLAVEEPAANTPFLTAIRHYGRAMAYTHTDRLDEAGQELAKLTAIAEDPAAAERMIGFSNAHVVLTIASEVVKADMAAKRGAFEAAAGHASRAVRLQDSMLYNEPPDWYYPTRHTLGAILLEAGWPAEAEVVYWQDLEQNPDNGYSLFGLAEALRRQGRTDEAVEIDTQFKAAWAKADHQLTSSRF